MSEPGWYNAEGDPPGTHRYWDGSQWVGDAVAAPGAPPMGGAPGETRGPRGRVSDPGKRMLGRFIDILIMFVIAAILIQFDLGGDVINPDAQDLQLSIGGKALDTRLEYLLFALVGFAWTTLWTHKTGGTPGKLMLGMRVADSATNETPINLQQSAMRAANSLLGILGLISLGLGALASGISLIIGLVSLILLFVDEEHRTVMDRFAKTFVIDK